MADSLRDAAALDADVTAVRAGFDISVNAEWERMVRDLPAQVSLELHRRMLVRHLRQGHRVLEIGAGPGRFTTMLAELGARVTVTDLSEAQLAANRRHVVEAHAEAAIDAWRVVDARDLSMFADAEFDLTVAFGGPLSYCFEAGGDALRGLLRITRPGGAVLASVMSLLGTFRDSLAGIVAAEEEFGTTANNAVLNTGDLRLLGRDSGHICQMYRSRDIPGLVEQADGELIEIAASNWASLGDRDALARIAADPQRWETFLEHEERACQEPGALDGGTHILFAARPTDHAREEPHADRSP
jgi:SAM-dependent methyltransferase